MGSQTTSAIQNLRATLRGYVNKVWLWAAERPRRFYLAPAFIIVALLLLLAVLSSRELESLNRDCMRCHVEMTVLARDKSSVHFPFKREMCTACHTLHGGQRVNVTSLLARLLGLGPRPAEGQTPRVVTDAGALFEIECSVCHLIDVVKNSSQTSAGWAAVIARMQDKGAEYNQAEADLLLRYLRESDGGNKEVDIKAERPSDLAEAKLVQDVPDLCANCHPNIQRERNLPVAMPPFQQGQCGACHAPHASDNEPILANSMPELCFGCHDGINLGPNGESTADYREMPVQMPPFRAGECTRCHYPHATEEPRLLKEKVPELCFDCHDTIPIGPSGETTADYREYPVQMQPFRQGQCIQCHNPHASPDRRLLKEGGVPNLCFSCHDSLAIGPREQTIADYRSKPVQMQPFREGKCFDCHYHAHGSPNYRLLKAPVEGNQICFLCHGEKKENFEKIEHSKVPPREESWYPNAGNGSCLNCHTPHGSDWIGLVQKEIINLCLDCHGSKSPFASIRKPRSFYAHPLGFKYTDPWHGDYMRCSSCHDPMGSGFEKLKRRDDDGLCVSCHDKEDPTFLWLRGQPGFWLKVHAEEGKLNPDGTDETTGPAHRTQPDLFPWENPP